MRWYEYLIWGAAGGAALEAAQFYVALRSRGDWPWQLDKMAGPLGYGVSIIIRVLLGLGLATAAGLSGQISGPFGAIAVGIAAPVIVERASKQALRQTEEPIS